jgi:acetyltransferase-like isoleucine patch superfamily enzyme
MKSIFKSTIIYLSRFSTTLRNNIDWGIIGSIPIPVLFVNFLFQRILRLNSKAGIQINYTSRVICFQNVKFYKDKKTIQSFILSTSYYIQALNGIQIGRNFLFGPGLRMVSSNHDSSDLSKSTSNNPIVIGDDVWFGSNVIILPGVKIANKCIVGAGSIVTKSFLEEGSVIAGNPAKKIK